MIDIFEFYGGYLEFFIPKESFKNDSSTSAQILFWGAIHAQSKEKQTFLSKKKLPLLLPDHIDFTDKNRCTIKKGPQGHPK